jgi:thioredoxin-like negative regulator of GroEL
MRPLLLLCFSLILLGCAQQHTTQVVVKPALPAPDKSFAQNLTIPTTDDFYRLTPSQQQHFLAFFHHPRVSHLEANARIYQYLLDDLESFSYQGASTMAQQTLENLSGNCMSLAVMVTALAKLVDVEVSYRATYTDPVLEISAQTMLSSNHVRSYLYNPIAEKNKQPLHLRSAIGIDYFRGSLDRIGQRMDNATFQAMVYNNLAVDALLAGDVAHSYWLSRAALKQQPTYKESINLIAIIYRRQGNFTMAKQWFDLGLSYHPANTSLISNYLVLAEQLNDLQLQAELQQQLHHSQDDNPYIWFSLAVKAERAEQYEDAIRFYRKLLRSAPYLHKANLALATLYLQQHDLAAAKTALTDALQYSYEPAGQARYQAKLQMLEQLAKQPALSE